MSVKTDRRPVPARPPMPLRQTQDHWPPSLRGVSAPQNPGFLHEGTLASLLRSSRRLCPEAGACLCVWTQGPALEQQEVWAPGSLGPEAPVKVQPGPRATLDAHKRPEETAGCPGQRVPLWNRLSQEVRASWWGGPSLGPTQSRSRLGPRPRFWGRISGAPETSSHLRTAAAAGRGC